MKRLAIIALVLFSFTGISLLTIGKGAFSPFHMLMMIIAGWFVLFGAKQQMSTFMSLNILAAYILLSNLLFHESFRFTSLLYSMVFILELTIFYNLIRRCPPKTLASGFRLIIYLYFFNIVAGLVLIKLGLHWPMLEEIVGIARTNAGTRPMGFSSEPSYAAFILTIAYLSYNHIVGIQWNRSTIRLTVVYILSIIIMGSAYGFILLLFTLLEWLRHFINRLPDSLKMAMGLVVLIIATASISMMSAIDNEAIERVDKVAHILGDPFSDSEKKMNKLKEEDPSAFARLGPTYMLFFSDKAEDLNLWMGAGAGAAGIRIPKLMEGVLIDEGDTEFDTGIIPAFIFDYGLIGMVSLSLFIINCFKNLPLPFWLVFLFILPNANINTQIFWFLIGAFLTVSIIKVSHKYRIGYYSRSATYNLST